MELVLTTGSSVSCDHPPSGGGPLALTGAAKGVLKVAGRTVLSGTLAGAAIDPGCAQKGANQVQCQTVASQDSGTSQVLKAGGAFVLLKSAGGTTFGAPDKGWSVKDAGQSLLRAD